MATNFSPIMLGEGNKRHVVAPAGYMIDPQFMPIKMMLGNLLQSDASGMFVTVDDIISLRDGNALSKELDGKLFVPPSLKLSNCEDNQLSLETCGECETDIPPGIYYNLFEHVDLVNSFYEDENGKLAIQGSELSALDCNLLGYDNQKKLVLCAKDIIANDPTSPLFVDEDHKIAFDHDKIDLKPSWLPLYWELDAESATVHTMIPDDRKTGTIIALESNMPTGPLTVTVELQYPDDPNNIEVVQLLRNVPVDLTQFHNRAVIFKVTGYTAEYISAHALLKLEA